MRTRASRWVVAGCSAALVFGSVTARAERPVDAGQQRLGRRLLIAGGVVGGVGLAAASVGFGVLGGIHLGNPGPGMELQFDDPSHGRNLVRTANGMMVVGMVGASLLLTGVILAGIGGHTLRQARASRITPLVGPRSLGLVVRF